MTNETNKSKGGFRSLAVYWLAKEIYYLNCIFCERYIPPTSRTFEQMIQAARSGKHPDRTLTPPRRGARLRGKKDYACPPKIAPRAVYE